MTTEIVYRERRGARRYHWPEVQLNVWIIVVLAGAATCLGVFAWFMTVQTQMRLGTPWIFPYMVSISAIAILFLLLILILAAQRSLIPGIIVLGSFISFVLWLTGLVGTAMQLYGTGTSVNSVCNTYVTNSPEYGATLDTLAWLTQNNICNCWKACFAFEIVLTVFFLWMMVMAWQVNRDEFD